MRKYLLILLTAILVTCTSSASADQKTKLEGDEQPSVFTPAEYTSLSSMEKAFVETVKKEKGVHQFGTLYVIAAGPKPSSGYGMKLEKQEQIWEQLKLYVKQTVPEEGKMYLDVITYPYLLGRLQLPSYTTLSIIDSESKKPFIEDENSKLRFMNKRFITNDKKVWTINFGRKMTKKSWQKYEIVIEKADGTKHPLEIQKDKRNPYALLAKPLKPYEKGSEYLLKIQNKKDESDVTIVPFELKTESKHIEINDNLTEQLHGWAGGFADLPVVHANDDYRLQFGHKAIPLKGEALKNGMMLSGMNRSDDLFMYAKKKISSDTGLLPNTTYAINMEVEFYTNVDPGLMGVGGAPGEGVTIKAGASTIEPVTLHQDGYLRMNVDKGNQSSPGRNAEVIGHAAKERVSLDNFEVKKVKTTSPLTAKTDKNGELWVFIGSDSGFEGITTLYYSNVKTSFTKTE